MVSDLSMGAKMNGSSINYVISLLYRHLVLPHSPDFLIFSKKKIKDLKMGPIAFLSKKDEERGIASASFSAIGLILLGGRLEQEQAEKACAAMSYLLFKKCWW